MKVYLSLLRILKILSFSICVIAEVGQLQFHQVAFAFQSQGGKPILSFCAGATHACAVFDNNKAKCWGEGSSYGASVNYGTTSKTIGDGLPYMNISSFNLIEKITCGVTHTCVILDTEDIKCLGDNTFGQIGFENSILNTASPSIGEWNGYVGDALPVVNVGINASVSNMASGAYHTCVVTSEGRTKCFGLNFYGELGQEDRLHRGWSASTMGDNLPYINLGTEVKVSSIYVSVSLAGSHNCVILSAPTASAQRIKCWGSNDYNQLGYGNSRDKGGERYEMGDNLTLVDLGTESRVKQLALGSSHTCALLYNNGLKCYGYGYAGQLASGSTSTITSAGNAIPFVQIDSGKTVKFVTAGYEHICIVYDDLITMKCAGTNSYGELGQGDRTQRGHTSTTTFPFIPAIQLGTGSLNISNIYSGQGFNCVVFASNALKCFGPNFKGQQAIGSITVGVGDDPNEMGSNLQFSQLFSSETPAPTPSKTPTASKTPNPSSSNAQSIFHLITNATKMIFMIVVIPLINSIFT